MCANDSKTIKNRSMLLCYHYYRLTVSGISSICYSTKTPSYIVTKSVYCTLLIASSCCQVNSATFIIVPFPIKTYNVLNGQYNKCGVCVTFVYQGKGQLCMFMYTLNSGSIRYPKKIFCVLKIFS